MRKENLLGGEGASVFTQEYNAAGVGWLKVAKKCQKGQFKEIKVDGIHLGLLRDVREEIAESATITFQTFTDLGVMPWNWKTTPESNCWILV